jgi:hypothetical protein
VIASLFESIKLEENVFLFFTFGEKNRTFMGAFCKWFSKISNKNLARSENYDTIIILRFLQNIGSPPFLLGPISLGKTSTDTKDCSFINNFCSAVFMLCSVALSLSKFCCSLTFCCMIYDTL